LSWDNDALTILFSNAKNDQEGRYQYPRHVYPNPMNPAICPILGLAMYWACLPLSNNACAETQLFPGTNQYSRYSKIMHRLWEVPHIKDFLQASGVEEGDLGSHSTRKGSATNCSSGSTSCPSQSAICLRAGWSMPGVQGTYIQYEAAGDQYVGRTASGLPVNDARFGVVGPYVIANNLEEQVLVDRIVSIVYPNLPQNCTLIGRWLIASLVYHKRYVLN
jgi:hypothetical protein